MTAGDGPAERRRSHLEVLKLRAFGPLHFAASRSLHEVVLELRTCRPSLLENASRLLKLRS